MRGFVDETSLEVGSGKGGAGCVSLRREKYIPKGGPDGGDGGKGGDVVFKIKKNLKTLSYLRFKRIINAGAGCPGEGRKKHGKDGEDAVILLPPGAVIKDFDTKEVLHDFAEDESDWIFLKGGRGGLGNMHFATSRQQTPRFGQPGLPGQSRKIIKEINIIADIGFVGFPNAGKSTLLGRLTNANPKVGAYPFTTKIPNLGVYKIDDQDIVLADIPGIIEGASEGAGLGLRFLKHIARTRGLVFLIDVSQPDFEEAFDILLNELRSFSPELAERKRVLFASKMDSEGSLEALEKLREKYPQEEIHGISVFSGEGMDQIRSIFSGLVLQE